MKTIRDVRDTVDPGAKVIYAACLLEYVLQNSAPNYTDATLGELVQTSDTFNDRSRRDINFALGLRNRIAHPSLDDSVPSDRELLRAANHLLTGVEAIIEEHPRSDPSGHLMSGTRTRRSAIERFREDDEMARVHNLQYNILLPLAFCAFFAIGLGVLFAVYCAFIDRLFPQ